MESDPPFQESYKALFEGLTEEEKAERVQENGNEKDDLPLIDLSGLSHGGDGDGGGPADKESCKREISEAARAWGFFQVVNHGISRDVLERVRVEQMELFGQPFSSKQIRSTISNSSPVKNSYCWGNSAATTLMQFSWSEAFHVSLTHVSELKEFRTTFSSPIEEFAKMVSQLALKIAAVLAESLGCKSTFFEENCLPSSCYLRLNRYPPCPKSSRVFGLVPHTDTNFLTILYQDHVGGLQLLKDGHWFSIKPNPDALIINIGDLFEAWSNGIYKSIEHRVITNGKVERFSVAYFLCPSDDTVIQNCSDDHAIYRKFSFKEYKQQVRDDVESTGSKIGLSRFLI